MFAVLFILVYNITIMNNTPDPENIHDVPFEEADDGGSNFPKTDVDLEAMNKRQKLEWEEKNIREQIADNGTMIGPLLEDEYKGDGKFGINLDQAA